MKIETLIKMANRIGDFFEAMPDREQAVRDIAGHLQRTWDPRMRTQLLDALDAPEAKEMKAIVRDAARMLEN